MVIISRIARKDFGTNFLHIMVQGINKEYIFDNERYIEKYLEIIKENIVNFNLTIMAYCIMNNHAHFLMYVNDINDLGKFMHKVNLLYSNWYNKNNNRCGVIFRNRYRSEPIYDMKYLINCIKYIHDNPVKANIVLKCEDYKYSSYGSFIKNGEITKSQIMKELFGTKYDYSRMFKQILEKRFMDVDDKNGDNVTQYLLGGISEFEKEFCKNSFEILSNRNLLKELIIFLKDKHRI